MAIRIVKAAADPGLYRWGVTRDETGINIKRWQVRYFPRVNERFPDQYGNVRVRSVSAYFSREILCEGEYVGAGGVMSFTLGASLAFANWATTWGPAGGSILLEDATYTEERDGWRWVSIRASSEPYV
jgi:hypothetical protein